MKCGQNERHVDGQEAHHEEDNCADPQRAHSAERKGQRREPAADDVRFGSELIGWLPFAALSGWAIRLLDLVCILISLARTHPDIPQEEFNSNPRIPFL
jgi:hypothetical protein